MPLQDERDPFPMSSPEAQRLAASVPQQDPLGNPANNNNNRSWHTMALQTTATTATTGINHDVDASERLVDGRKATGGTGDHSNNNNNNSNSMLYANDADGLEDDHDDEDAEDDFFDRPLSELRGSRWERGLATTVRVVRRGYHRLYGDQLPFSEMVRSLCLATTLFFMIGGYWLLRSLKDPVMSALCGIQYVPRAKMISVVVVFAVVSIYNRLIDSDLPKHKLFYVFGTIYFGIFFIISILLQDPNMGLPNQQASPSRWLGWISYCAIESFGSVMVSLFWSFANSNISLETAKASYGVMVATAQVGSILGPTIVRQYAGTNGVAQCYMVGAVSMLLLQATMYLYIYIYGTAERNATNASSSSSSSTTTTTTRKKKAEANIWEGLQLFWEHHYVKGIFAISCLFMVIETIVDYIMKVLATDFFYSEYPLTAIEEAEKANGGDGTTMMSQEATEAFATFMGMFGQATNLLSFLLSLLGTGAVIRFLGLRITLLLFPIICLGMAVIVRIQPTLYVVFGAMMILKACSYALNNPTKEMLYQPTSSAVRYKAKSWIDIFGGRGSKALGSVVTNAFSHSTQSLIANGSLVSMLVAIGLIWNARYMGRKFDEYVASGHVVGDSNNNNGDACDGYNTTNDQELAEYQNDRPDTSCAILDKDDEVGPEEEGQVAGTGGGGGGVEGSSKDDAAAANVDDDNNDNNKVKPDVTMV